MIKMLQKHFMLLLISCAIVAMAISLTIGMTQSVWFDESYSIMLAKQQISQLIHLTAVDTHPPLFYLILKVWAAIFGYCELALRTLPVLFMGGAVIVAGLLMKKLFNKRAAILSMPFVIFAPFLLRYGFEIRMYSLVSLIGVLATYVLICALEATTKRKRVILYISYALLVAVGVYTLYYSVLLWMAHLVWLIWRTLKSKESLLKAPWLKAYILSIILFLPWLPIFISQIANGALAPIAMPMTIDNLMSIASYSYLYSPSWQLGAGLSVVMIFVVVSSLYFVIMAYKVSANRYRQHLVLLAMYITVPVLILTVVGFVRPMYVERYLSHVLIGASLWVGASISIVLKQSKPDIKLIYATMIAVMIVGISQLALIGNYNYQRSQSIDVKQAVADIKCTNGEVVLAADPYEAIESSYYLSDCPIYFYSISAKQIGGYSILSDSSYRVTSPATQLADKKTIYVIRYTDLKLQMPVNLKLTYKHQYGKFGVDKYSAH